MSGDSQVGRGDSLSIMSKYVCIACPPVGVGAMVAASISASYEFVNNDASWETMRVSAPPLPPLLAIPTLRAPPSEELERRRMEDQGLLQPLEDADSDFWDTLSSDSDQSTDPEDFLVPPPPPPF